MAEIFHAINPIGNDCTLCGDASTELDEFVVKEQPLPAFGFPITCPLCLRIIDACVGYAARHREALTTGTAVGAGRAADREWELGE